MFLTPGSRAQAREIAQFRSYGSVLVRADGTPYLVGDSSGHVGIGQTTPLAVLHVGGDNFNPTIYFDDYGGISRLIQRSCNGTRALPTQTLADGFIALLGAKGYGTTRFVDGSQARISFHAAEDVTDTAQGAYISFETTLNGNPTGAATLERMRVGNDGKIGIAQTAAAALLHVTSDNFNPTIIFEDYGGLARVICRSANGTRSLPTQSLTDGAIGLIGARGYGISAFATGNQARVTFRAAEDMTDSAQGAYLTLDTTPKGTAGGAAGSSIERLRVDNTGAISIGSLADAAASALLDVTSTTRGALMPRMTKTQRDAISSPATGLIIHNTTNQQPEFYNGARWLGAQAAANLAMHSYGGL